MSDLFSAADKKSEQQERNRAFDERRCFVPECPSRRAPFGFKMSRNSMLWSCSAHREGAEEKFRKARA